MQFLSFLDGFEQRIAKRGLRSEVRQALPSCQRFLERRKREQPVFDPEAARRRLIVFFLQYPVKVIKGQELMVVAGTRRWDRRVRELRVQFGWRIVSGLTVRQMISEGDLEECLDGEPLSEMGPSDYVLLDPAQDREAAHRWHVANSIRRGSGGARERILKFLRKNVGARVSGEELRYVAGKATQWPRRIRELRTEHGWPILTRNTGRPDLGVGEYILEADRQTPKHDRRVPDHVRREVLNRDMFRCSECAWHQSKWRKEDPRHLEVHHVRPHAQGGKSEVENLTTLCVVCHDLIHARGRWRTGD